MTNTIFIDVLKSFACLCVVLGHVVRGLRKGPIDVSPILKAAGDFVYYFHVPCFFFASGYLYAKNRLKTGRDYMQFVGRKLLILGLPYFACTVFYVLVGPLISSDAGSYHLTDMIRVLFTEPIAQYWFLYALFEMFVVVPLVEMICVWGGGKWEQILLLFFVCMMGVRADAVWIKYLLLYTGFFYLGVYFRRKEILSRYRSYREHPQGTLLIGGAASVGIFAFYKLFTVSVPISDLANHALKGLIELLLVICMVLMAAAVAELNGSICRCLCRLPKYSLYIYLLHTWFTGTARVLLCRMGVSNGWIHFVCGMAVGVAGSLAAAVVIRRFAIFRFWFEPEYRQ